VSKQTNLEKKVLVAANQWLVDRRPKDPAEKALAAAVMRAWPEELVTRETCPCGESETCDECPTAAEMEVLVTQWERDSAPQPPDDR